MWGSEALIAALTSASALRSITAETLPVVYLLARRLLELAVLLSRSETSKECFRTSWRYGAGSYPGPDTSVRTSCRWPCRQGCCRQPWWAVFAVTPQTAATSW